MKRVEIIINEDGNYEIDCKEGFEGVACDKKTLEIFFQMCYHLLQKNVLHGGYNV